MSEIEELVIQGIRDRRDAGREEHGATMERQDLSVADWLENLEEELTDAAVYSRKLRELVGVLRTAMVAFDDALYELRRTNYGGHDQYKREQMAIWTSQLADALAVLDGKPLDAVEAEIEKEDSA